ncbi:MAG: response regulator [Chloroflexi bacterium]|nr:response regulator [Chloroflexota bacterium]MBV9546361.1 response regulator [Chloroflexota bacterium]
MIDDDDSIRRVVSDTLRASGYRAECAADGLEALDSLRARRPSAIVLDLSMPNVDGWQFLNSYRDLTDGDDIPILVASAQMDPNVETDLRKLGADACLTKPFDVDDLLDNLERVLASPGRLTGG